MHAIIINPDKLECFVEFLNVLRKMEIVSKHHV